MILKYATLTSLALATLCTPLAAEVSSQETSPVKETHAPILSAIGTIYPQYKSTIGSQVTGRLQDVFVHVGDKVKKGQPLAKIDTVFFRIDFAQKDSALKAAKLELADSELNLNRMKKLWDKPEGETPSIPQKRFDDAKTKYEQALISVTLAEDHLKRAKVQLQEALIKAPFDGVVTKRYVDPGESITAAPSTKIVELQCVSSVYIEFAIPQLELSRVSTGSPVKLELDGAKATDIFANIDLVYPDIDEATRSVKCRVYIRDVKEELRPGSLVKVQIFPLPLPQVVVQPEEGKEGNSKGDPS